MDNNLPQNTQPKEKSWLGRHPLLIGGGVVLLLILLIASGNNQSTSTGDSSSSSSSTQASSDASDNSQLNVSAAAGANGIYVTNNESSEWTNCMVGLNGPSGFGFDNPPFKTQTALSFSPNVQTFVPFNEISESDGTIFDPTSHTINSIVIECGQGTDNLRSWMGDPTVPTTSSNETPSANTADVPAATTQTANAPVMTATPLSEAVENYSDTIASNVDVTATITQLLPQQSGITAAFGNTIMATDGIYTAAVHQIDSSDFQQLAVGDTVEIKGGYMQDPENNVVQIVRTGSVSVVSGQN